MIIFDLKCDKGHKFEGWFKDSSAFEEQKSAKLITCPVCGNADTVRIPSSIAVMTRGDKTPEKKNEVEISPLKYLQMLHQPLEKHFENVGGRFA